jgi:quercetin dioxygenase-like cupin family protein
MKVTKQISALVVVLAGLVVSQSRAAEPDPKIMSVTLPEKIDWKEGGGNATAVLVGDPSKPGLYVELVKWHAGQMSQPHMHPSARYITVISGTWWVGWGPKFDPASTYPVKAGSFVVHHPNQLHYDGAKEADCVIEIVGIGPER